MWNLDEQQQQLQDSARDFLAERAPVAHLRALRDAGDASTALGHSPALWREFADQGYAAMLVADEHGGLGLGPLEAGVLAEQIGHTLTPAPWLSSAVLAATLLQRAGTAAQQADWLRRIASAQARLALAIDEAPRHRPDRVQTRATRSGDGWRLDGSKTLVVDGAGADGHLVSALADGALSLWLLPAGTPGLVVEALVQIDAHGAARLTLDGVRLPDSARLSSAPDAAAALDATLDLGRAVIAAELQGLADQVFQRTLAYLKERKQFDRAIGEFQALQHRAAELHCDLELSRAIVAAALDALATEAAAPALSAATARLVSQAKARACLTANRAVQEGVQMHGGIGMTDALDFGLFMARARVLQTWLGDAGFHLDRAARLSNY